MRVIKSARWFMFTSNHNCPFNLFVSVNHIYLSKICYDYFGNGFQLLMERTQPESDQTAMVPLLNAPPNRAT